MRQRTEPGLPHREIRLNGDRSWSIPLVEMIRHWNPEENYEEIIDSLRSLDHYRTVEPLIALTEDHSLPAAQRLVASRTVRQLTTWESAERRRKWLNSGDSILEAQAIALATPAEAHLLEEIANNPNSTHQADALRKFDRAFDEPRYIGLLLNALTSRNRVVRRNATFTLVWTEPIAATERLLEMVREDEPPTANRAFAVLRHMTQQQVLMHLCEAVGDTGVRRKQLLEDLIRQLRGEFRLAARRCWRWHPQAFPFFLEWLAPIERDLDLDIDISNWEAPKERPPIIVRDAQREPHSAESVIEYFEDDYLSRRKIHSEFDRLREKWFFSEDDQRKLVSHFAAHPNWFMRRHACAVFPQWQTGDVALVELLTDDVPSVRDAAADALRHVAPNGRLSATLLELILNRRITPQAIETFCHHGDAVCVDQTNATLEDLVRTSQSQSITRCSASSLSERRAREQVAGLVPILSMPPLLNWSTHTELLRACNELDVVVPQANELRRIDELGFQYELARTLARQS